MTRLADLILNHKRLVVAFWALVTVAAFVAVGPAGNSLSQEFNIPGREGFETNREIAEVYGNGGDVAPLVPVVTLPKGTTVDSAGVTAELAVALAKVKQAMPNVRIASYASTHDRAFVSKDGRTTFALVYHPAVGGVDPGQVEARQAEAALAGVTVGGSAVRVTGLNALRASAADNGGGGTGVLVGDTARRSRGVARPRLRVPVVHGARADADGRSRDSDHLPPHLADRVRHRCLRDRAVPRRADRARDRDRLRAPRCRPLAGRAKGRRRRERDRRPQRDEARRLLRRLQRHDRGNLAALPARPADARAAQHRHRRPPDRTRQRRSSPTRFCPSSSRPSARGSTGPARPETTAQAAPGQRGPESSSATADLAAIASTAVLAALVVAASHIQLGNPQADSLAQKGAARVGLEQLKDSGIGTGPISPFEALVRSGNPAAVAAAIANVDGVQSTATPTDWRRNGTAIVTVIPTEDGNSAAGRATLERIRAANIENATVGGEAAQSADFLDAVYGNFPLMILAISVLTFILLARAFRSIILPLKAVLLNLLSVAAAWGLTVLVWQDGFGSNAIWGIEATQAINVEMPIVIFAFLFGISMDYQVFIISRMREAYDRTGSTETAVVEGIGRTGRLVTSAALILFLAFVAFSASPGTEAKMFATALGGGILIDATIIRGVLAPAAVAMLGRWNWWLPAWAAWLLRVEPSEVTQSAEPDAVTQAA